MFDYTWFDPAGFTKADKAIFIGFGINIAHSFFASVRLNQSVREIQRSILTMIFLRNFSVEIFLRTISRVLNHVKKNFLKNSLEKLSGHGRQKLIMDVKKIVLTI